MLTLRQDQSEAIERLRQSLRSGKRRPMLQSPTGAGKTRIASAIVERVLSKGKTAAFVVPRISLVDQTIEAFGKEGIKAIGVIQGQHNLTDYSQPLQVCSAQTLQRRGYPKADLVIIDEAHLHFAIYSKWFLDPAWRDIPFIGLSATPFTRGLGRYYDDLIIAMTTEEAIDKGILCPFRVYAPAHPDLTGVRIVAGDYHEGELSAAMNKQPLVADIVNTWFTRAFMLRTIVFGVDRAHAKHIQEQFTAQQINAGYMDAFTPLLEREAIKNRFHSGETKVVCNCDVLTLGVDWRVDCLILAAPTRSEIRHVQRVGRVLRIDPTNPQKNALILDHSDTHLRLGMVTDIKHTELDMGRARVSAKTDRIALPKECPSCAYLKPPRMAKCPACGFTCEAHSKIEPKEGELQELKRKKPEPTIFEKQEWYASLSYIAMERKYKPGWAAQQYRTKFGVWPRGMDAILPRVPTDEVVRWVKYTTIRWAKHREKEAQNAAAPA